jgi:AmiR/NasT family two-component response regulator
MCLSVRDRILDADWRAHGLARNPTLESSLHASHRRFAARVGRSPDIDRAKELIAARLGCSPEEAFAVLRRLSQKRNEKLAAVARGVVAAEERRRAGGAGASPSLR